MQDPPPGTDDISTATRLGRIPSCRIDGKRLLQQFLNLRLTIVIVNLEPVVGVKLRTVPEKELDYLAKKRIVDGIASRIVLFVDLEACIGDVHPTEECEHMLEYASSFFARHQGILLFAPNQRPRMHAMASLKPHRQKRTFKPLYLSADINVLVMKNHAEKIVWRNRIFAQRHEAPRFIHKDAYLPCSIHMQKQRRGTGPRLRQETFPHAGDSDISVFVGVYCIKFPCWSARGGGE